MGTEFIFSVISTLAGLLSSLRSSGATSADGEGDGIERDLDRLERLLRRIQASLRDAGEREIRDEYVKLWLKELKAVAYEAEDILDKCQYELLRRQIEESGGVSSSSAGGKKRRRLDGAISDEMAERIKGVIERFEEISRDKDALSLKEDDGERQGSIWTVMLPTSHMVNESVIFGRDKDKQKILDFVLSDDTERRNPISVVAIVGMGGVGKTTVAQLVYNDSRVKCTFDMMAWVYVSPESHVIKVTKEILDSINPGKLIGGLTGLSTAQIALVESVTEKKLFIVLDDVCNESPSKWEQFLEPLRAAEFVKIVMTTRNEAVAQKSGVSYTHHLSCLSKYQSGLLFGHYVYGGQFVDEYSCLKKIGVQIIKKCAGLPLAIKSIARALSYKMDEDSWRYILESELWKSDGKDEIFPALKVSYYNLPSELKPCFLFCSLFPKGSQLRMNEIIYMWIAHGYVRPCGSRRAEDIGNELLHELYRRSFLTKVCTLKQRGLEYFVMHDLIHDLARSISMGEICCIDHENTSEAYSGVYHAYVEKCGLIDGLSRRCLLMRTLITKYEMDPHMYNILLEKFLCEDKFEGDEHGLNFNLDRLKFTNPPVRLFSSKKEKFANPDYDLDLKGCYNYKVLVNRNLCVLRWEGANAHDLANIDNLKHLRYLELNNDVLRYGEIDCPKLERLPESMTHLFNLVSLQLYFLEGLIELPINFGKLINLRSLDIIWLGIRDLPESLGHLGNLQYLSVSSCKHLQKFPSSIGNLSSLKQLYISDLNIRELPESFCMLQNLQTLSVDGCWEMTQIPSDIGDLTNLQWLYCSRIGIGTLPESMKRLCNLKVLELSCIGSPVALLFGFERLLSRSSLNFSVERLDGRKQESCQIKEDSCKYVKTQRLIESLQSVSDLVKFEINGYVGVGYAFSKNWPFITSIAMHCHVEGHNLFTELGELPLLKSLTLVMITSVRNLQFSIPRTSKVLFTSLKELEFVDMPEWSDSVGKRDGDFPVLESLKIKNCPKLSSVPNIGNNLRKLEINRCSFSKLELDLVHLQLLESLIIGECIQLTLIHGLPSLNSLQTLCVFRCPLLRDFVYRKMPNSPLSVEIVECPSMKDWCQIQQFNYIEFYSGAVNLSQNVLIEHPGIQNGIKLDQCLYTLTMLERRGCWRIEKLDWIRGLVLCDCPLLQLKNSSNNSETINYGGSAKIRLLPSVESLVFEGCHKMLSLNLSVEDGSSLIELKITNCKRLKYITGLQELAKLEKLTLFECPQLLLQPLDSVPKHVVISRCPRLKGWCKWHSVEPIDEEEEQAFDAIVSQTS